jgi:hypothetical protein
MGVMDEYFVSVLLFVKSGVVVQRQLMYGQEVLCQSQFPSHFFISRGHEGGAELICCYCGHIPAEKRDDEDERLRGFRYHRWEEEDGMSCAMVTNKYIIHGETISEKLQLRNTNQDT